MMETEQKGKRKESTDGIANYRGGHQKTLSTAGLNQQVAHGTAGSSGMSRQRSVGKTLARRSSTEVKNQAKSVKRPAGVPTRQGIEAPCCWFGLTGRPFF